MRIVIIISWVCSFSFTIIMKCSTLCKVACFGMLNVVLVVFMENTMPFFVTFFAQNHYLLRLIRPRVYITIKKMVNL